MARVSTRRTQRLRTASASSPCASAPPASAATSTWSRGRVQVPSWKWCWMADMTRVLVADDHPPTRAGVRAALEGEGFVVCAEAADADGAVARAVHEQPDVCL